MLTATNDPISRALANLPPVLPRETHDRRVRERCHAVLARRRTRARQLPRSLRFTDLLMAGGAALYVLTVVTEAVRLL